MKSYTYNGTGILSFTYDTRDFVAHGKGPHQLPADAPNVIVLVKKGELVETEEPAEVIEPETENEIKP